MNSEKSNQALLEVSPSEPEIKRSVSFNLFDDPKAESRIDEKSSEKLVRKRNRAALTRFLDHEDYTYENFKVNKADIFKKAFTQQLTVVYDKNASQVEKLREVLLSPQLNLIIIILIVVDWIFAVIELFTDLISEKTSSVLAFEQTVTYLSIAIIAFFLMEVVLKIFVATRYFFSSKLEIFDGLIVIISFCLEIFFAIKKQDFEGVGSILTIFRFWRILRIISSTF
jgi:hypothetical protein